MKTELRTREKLPVDRLVAVDLKHGALREECRDLPVNCEESQIRSRYNINPSQQIEVLPPPAKFDTFRRV